MQTSPKPPLQTSICDFRLSAHAVAVVTLKSNNRMKRVHPIPLVPQPNFPSNSLIVSGFVFIIVYVFKFISIIDSHITAAKILQIKEMQTFYPNYFVLCG